MTLRHFVKTVLCITIGAGAGGSSNVTTWTAAAAGSIGGHVRDTAGQPLPGVSVTMIPERGGSAMNTTTDREGAYRLDAVADDTYRLDFQLRGFDLIRQNHVHVRPDTHIELDASTSPASICECISSGLAGPSKPLAGLVVDEDNRPLPHARVDIVSPKRRETTYTDRDGRFFVHPPVDGTWPLTASDSGFAVSTQRISKRTAGPVVLRLRYVGAQSVPNIERFEFGCLCPEAFTQSER
jgi:hypothetical protein